MSFVVWFVGLIVIYAGIFYKPFPQMFPTIDWTGKYIIYFIIAMIWLFITHEKK